MKRQTDTDTIIHDLQARYPFANALSYYFQGVSGTPEAMEQKAFVHCLMTEFPNELGRIEIPCKDTPDMPKVLYTRLVVSVANFYDGSARYTKTGKRVSIQMQRFKAMGYQDGTADILILYAVKPYHGFVCEMKHPGGHYTTRGNVAKPGKATQDQIVTIDDLKSIGYYACVGIGFLEALGHWLTYLGY
jgi:hypothetical protein